MNQHNLVLLHTDFTELLSKVIDVIETRKKVVVKRIWNKLVINRINYRPHRESYKVKFRKGVGQKVIKRSIYETVDYKMNLTNVFLKSGDTSPIRYLLNIVIALKSSNGSHTNKNIDNDLVLAFNSVDFSLANKLYNCSHNKLSGILNNIGNRPYFNFYVPTLNLATKEEAIDEMKKIYKDEFINDKPGEFDNKVMEAIVKKQESNNEDFIKRLTVYFKIAEDEVVVPDWNKVEDLVEDDNLPGI